MTDRLDLLRSDRVHRVAGAALSSCAAGMTLPEAPKAPSATFPRGDASPTPAAQGPFTDEHPVPA